MQLPRACKGIWRPSRTWYGHLKWPHRFQFMSKNVLHYRHQTIAMLYLPLWVSAPYGRRDCFGGGRKLINSLQTTSVRRPEILGITPVRSASPASLGVVIKTAWPSPGCREHRENKSKGTLRTKSNAPFLSTFNDCRTMLLRPQQQSSRQETVGFSWYPRKWVPHDRSPAPSHYAWSVQSRQPPRQEPIQWIQCQVPPRYALVQGSLSNTLHPSHSTRQGVRRDMAIRYLHLQARSETRL